MLYSKSILFVLIYLILFVGLQSCNDNSIAPIQGCSDSARFYWTVDTIYESNITGDLWAPDTNNIFAISRYENFIIRRNNGVYSRINFASNEQIYTMVGDNIDNGYLFGAIEENQNFIPAVWKWNGNGFTNIPTNNVIRNRALRVALYVSPVEMWISGVDYALKFDGLNFTPYNIPDSILITDIFYDKLNNLKMLGMQGTTGLTTFFILEFKNNSWEIIHTGTTLNNEIYYHVFNNEIIGFGNKGVYTFDGQNFQNIISLCESNFIFSIAGSSFNDLFGILNPESPNESIYKHWNGIKWSNEKVLGSYGVDRQLRRIDNNHYVGIHYIWSYSSYNVVYLARRK